MSSTTLPETSLGDRDALTRFMLEGAGVRGVVVRLNQTWKMIRERAEYPAAVASQLAECCAAAALFTGHAKVDGRLSIQLKGQGAVRTLFAECTHEGTLRGIAQFTAPVPETLGPRQMGPDALLAITIETRHPGTSEPARYQGLVDMQADTLAEAFENYFSQSEQLPTRIALVCLDGVVSGLMIQQLPGDHVDPDGWTRCSALFDTLGANELASTPVQTLLYRLFHEDGVRLLATEGLEFSCSCSRQRVLAMMFSLGREEALAAAEDGAAQVTCEFCNAHYEFHLVELEQIFQIEGDPGRPN